MPRLIVLDEPNSSLDEAGELALLTTLSYLKQQKCAVMIISHRTNILSVVDNMLLLIDGQVKAFGPKDDVLAAINGGQKPANPSGAVGVQK
jgi:ABC-type protease/lipase transport system fused ATPase/permease subunit